MTMLVQQETQLSQRDRATRLVGENLVKCYTAVRKNYSKRLVVAE